MSDNLIHLRPKANARKAELLSAKTRRTPRQEAEDDRYLKLLSLVEEQHIQITQLRGSLRFVLATLRQILVRGQGAALVVNTKTGEISTSPNASIHKES